MNSSAKVSVALCTCDGERYLQEQLFSLLAQSSLPGEIQVCDDLSTDATNIILERVAHDTPVKVQVHRNTARQGVGANFELAISRCSGAYIALCDQDDVWLSDKLAVFERAFAQGATWVACDASVVDASLHSLGYTLWQRMRYTSKEQRAAQDGAFFEVLLKHYVVAGATLAFRTELRDVLLPIPPGWHYDAWLAAMLAALSPGVLIQQPLQLYRQHATNLIGGGRRSLMTDVRTALSLDRDVYYIEEINRWSQLAERLDNIDAPVGARRKLAAKIAHLERRARLPHRRLARIPAIAAEFLRGGYAHYSRNWGSIAIDLLGR